MNFSLKKNIKQVDRKLRQISNLQKYKRDSLPRESSGAGVYILSEGKTVMYVGRANCISDRLLQHSRPSSGHNAASFAFRVARDLFKPGRAAYTKDKSRGSLMENGKFLKVFGQSKERIRKMDIRFILEPDPVTQALLEICAAVELKSRYNDFDNH